MAATCEEGQVHTESIFLGVAVEGMICSMHFTTLALRLRTALKVARRAAATMCTEKGE